MNLRKRYLCHVAIVAVCLILLCIHQLGLHRKFMQNVANVHSKPTEPPGTGSETEIKVVRSNLDRSKSTEPSGTGPETEIKPARSNLATDRLDKPVPLGVAIAACKRATKGDHAVTADRWRAALHLLDLNAVGCPSRALARDEYADWNVMTRER
eukprot:COSAG01_NODE_19363_length_1014_cov_1.567213_1_plen_153_part_01